MIWSTSGHPPGPQTPNSMIHTYVCGAGHRRTGTGTGQTFRSSQDSCTPTPALLVTAGEQVTVVKQKVSSNCFDSN